MMLSIADLPYCMASLPWRRESHGSSESSRKRSSHLSAVRVQANPSSTSSIWLLIRRSSVVFHESSLLMRS